MNSNRKIAIIVGVLFIAATAAGVFGGMLTRAFGGPSNAPDYLSNIFANENQLIIGSLFIIIMGFAAAGIGITMYPVLKKQSEALALGFAAFRIIEGVLFSVSVVGIFSILTLSQEFVKAGVPAASHFQTLGILLKDGQFWAYHVGTISFCFAAAMFYYSLYQSKLIPRWLSVFGVIATILLILVNLLEVTGIVSELMILKFPIFLNEIVLALWLIVKGFNPSALDSVSA